MNRSEHLAWCKERAEEYLDNGDITSAWASMASDLNKHDDTRGHSAVMLGMQLIMIGDLDTVPKMRKFIRGFN